MSVFATTIAGAFGKHAQNIRGTDMLPFVEHYFREVNRVVTANGKKYKIGVYGSGAVCKHIRAKGLAEQCWLAMSTGWPGYKEVLKSGKWSMAQQLSTFCKGWKFNDREMVRFDFNRVNGGNLGQWSKKSAVRPAGLPGKCKPSW